MNAWTKSAMALLSLVVLGGCAGMTTQERNAAIGAGAGAVAGSVLSGGQTGATVGGAVVGGVVGSQVKK
ncbi:MAG: hypothetical protein A3F78_05230 [Burkholderiales bacterium RIFCSPLOWO2_12_FULL_61_40]|nr:MAG: hypothetical protein A3F78_05230 [Burkholderiales bacterium RIFCSPLOWO2_12_FULL_61_40]